MDLRTALVVERKRDDYEDELNLILQAATREETEAAERQAIGPTARQRFSAIGQRIMAMTDETQSIGSGESYVGDLHKGMTELGVNGLGIVVKARKTYTPGRVRTKELNYLEVEWIKDSHSEGAPMAKQEVGLSEVVANEDPGVYGKLRLMEQSLAVAELARYDTPIAS